MLWRAYSQLYYFRVSIWVLLWPGSKCKRRPVPCGYTSTVFIVYRIHVFLDWLRRQYCSSLLGRLFNNFVEYALHNISQNVSSQSIKQVIFEVSFMVSDIVVMWVASHGITWPLLYTNLDKVFKWGGTAIHVLRIFCTTTLLLFDESYILENRCPSILARKQ